MAPPRAVAIGGVVRFRPLGAMAWLSRRYGGGMVNPLFLGLYFPLVSTWAAWVPWQLVRDEPRPVALGVFWGTAAVVYAAMTWAYYIRPRRDHLVLHRDGFRFGFNFLGYAVARAARWDELQSVVVGFTPPGHEAAVRSLARISPRRATAIREMAAATLVVRPVGDRPPFNVLLYRFEPADSERFVTYLREHCPGLVKMAEPTPTS